MVKKPNNFSAAGLRSLRARAIRQALGYTTSEFVELTGIPYGSMTQWGYPDKGSLSVPHCYKLIAALKAKNIPMNMAFLAEGDMSDLSHSLAQRVSVILENGSKITDRQADELINASLKASPN